MRKTVFRLLDWVVLMLISAVIGAVGAGLISAFVVPQGTTASVSGLEVASVTLGFVIDSGFFVFAAVIAVSACALGCLCLTLRAPLRLIINVEGVTSGDSESFAIDLIPGRVQPEEIKAKIEEFLAGA
jgi:hypothetical protein